jgi:hypothetical protein
MSWWARPMATEVARSYASSLLPLGPYEEHIHNHPENIGSATQFVLMRAENCIVACGHVKQLL